MKYHSNDRFPLFWSSRIYDSCSSEFVLSQVAIEFVSWRERLEVIVIGAGVRIGDSIVGPVVG